MDEIYYRCRAYEACTELGTSEWPAVEASLNVHCKRHGRGTKCASECKGGSIRGLESICERIEDGKR
jgi:hypothetical protein